MLYIANDRRPEDTCLAYDFLLFVSARRRRHSNTRTSWSSYLSEPPIAVRDQAKFTGIKDECYAILEWE